MVCFYFFESRNFLPKSLGLGFLTRVSASLGFYHSPPLQDKHFFSQVELTKLLLKAVGLQKGPISYPFLGDQWKSLHLWSSNVMCIRWCAVQNKGSTLNSLQLTKFIQHGFSCYTVICIHHAVESLFSFVPCVINSFGLITQCTLINAA